MAEQKADPSAEGWMLKDEQIAQACRDGFVWYPVVSEADRNIAKAQAKALIAAIEKHFWKAWDGSPYLLSFGEETKHTCISLDWDWWQQLKQEVERG